ncbi:MAG: thioredoxin [Ruminococcaceae bacterium]|nr:thioredoxin [Oscillospiraceae bacterium]
MAAIKITNDNFEAEVLRSDVPVLVDFWAPWCGPCQMLAPVIAQLAEDYEGTAKVGKINVDEEPQLAARFGIVSIPTVKVFRGGTLSGSLVGLRSKTELEALLH